MEPIIPIRIRLLPFLVQQKVIKMMNPMAQLDICQCSKIMKQIAKASFKTGNYSMHLSILDFLLFSIYTPDQTVRSDFSVSTGRFNPNQADFTIVRRKIGNYQKVMCHLRDDQPVMDTFWNDKLAGAKTIYKELNEIFGISLSSMEIDLDLYTDYASVLRWLNKMEIKSWVFNGINFEDSEFEYLMDHVVAKHSVKIAVKPSDGFKMSCSKVKIDHLKLENSHWISLKNLQQLKSVTLDLNNINLSDEILNMFLRNLDSPNLEYLILRFIRVLDIEKVLEGLEAEKVKEEDVRSYSHHEINVTNKDFFNFRLQNGNLCSVGFRDTAPTGEGPKTMEIVIWKD